MAVLGLRFCARAFSSRGKRGPPLIAMRGPPTIMASLVAEHRLQTCRLSNCGSRGPAALRHVGYLPDQGSNPCPLHRQADSQPLRHQGSPNSLYFKVYFICYVYCYISFLLISICMEYLFPSPHFQSVYVPRSEVGLL